MFPALTEFFNSLAVSFDLPILEWIQANLSLLPTGIFQFYFLIIPCFFP